MTGEAPKKRGWLARLRDGLARSGRALTDNIAGLFTRRALDDALLEELEDALIAADLGPATAARIVEELSRTRLGKEVSEQEVRGVIARIIAETLAPVARPLVIDPAHRPHVVLIVGVNGTGKTTTIGKLARQFRDRGLTVMLAAADTFRAAAIEQLEVWGARSGCPVVTGAVGADPASVAFEALARARSENIDVLIIDTAGRLHNKADLMAELEKIVRVLAKQETHAPHDTVLVLDATTGQNALSQVAVFREVARITGVIMTKLDGTARGGVLVACAAAHKLPVHAIGVGESVDDLQPFEADAFARALAGLENGAPADTSASPASAGAGS